MTTIENYEGFQIDIDPDLILKSGYIYTVTRGYFMATDRADHLLEENAIKQAQRLIDLVRDKV